MRKIINITLLAIINLSLINPVIANAQEITTDSIKTETDEEYRNRVRQENFDKVSNRIDLDVCKDPNNTVTVPDDNVTKILSKSITPVSSSAAGSVFKVSDLQTITVFNGGSDIDDLTGLQCSTKMSQFKISRSRIDNVDALINMHKLDDVKIEDSLLEDLSGLSGATNVNILMLDNNKIKDVTPLATMGMDNAPKAAWELSLENNQITDITPLAKIRDVQIIVANNNNISGALPTFNAPHLSQLHLSDNQIDDISSVENLKNDLGLKITLALENNKIIDMSPAKKWIIETSYPKYNAHNQDALPPIQTIYTDDPIVYTIYDEKGVGHDIDLGVPVKGMNSYDITWDYGFFSGKATIRYNYIPLNKPIFSGIDDITLNVNDSFNPLDGVSATDKEDGDVTKDIVVDDSKLQLDTPGVYTVSYSVADSDSNTTTADRKVTVSSSTSNGKPTFDGVNDITLNVNDRFNPLDGITATDKEDGDLTSKIVVDDSNLQLNTPGVYTIYYSVADSDSNITNIDRKVTIEYKNVKPNKPDNGNDNSSLSETGLSIYIMFNSTIILLAVLFIKRKLA